MRLKGKGSSGDGRLAMGRMARRWNGGDRVDGEEPGRWRWGARQGGRMAARGQMVRRRNGSDGSGGEEAE
ncbi:unnamed protein product [Spirodela intermedia]|uniref:Uncharacterized protein n=1 Tax=Spirodela intermedia TaxID=51605 RepID=A0ABN7EAJ0_SPIIN|nr:unnamed protein product [Spirodela intermedia]